MENLIGNRRFISVTRGCPPARGWEGVVEGLFAESFRGRAASNLAVGPRPSAAHKSRKSNRRYVETSKAYISVNTKCRSLTVISLIFHVIFAKNHPFEMSNVTIYAAKLAVVVK